MFAIPELRYQKIDKVSVNCCVLRVLFSVLLELLYSINRFAREGKENTENTISDFCFL